MEATNLCSKQEIDSIQENIDINKLNTLTKFEIMNVSTEEKDILINKFNKLFSNNNIAKLPDSVKTLVISYKQNFTNSIENLFYQIPDNMKRLHS